MLRVRAVQDILLSEIAGVPQSEDAADQLAALETARRRAWFMVFLDWVAILVLVLLRQGPGDVLELGASVHTIYALGLLAVATHAGFRLGQIDKIAAVRRALGALPLGSGDTNSET